MKVNCKKSVSKSGKKKSGYVCVDGVKMLRVDDFVFLKII